MTQEERIVALLAIVEEHGRVTAEEICTRFSVSRDSARRDLVRLTAMSGIQRIRGGAIRAPVSTQPLSYRDKNTPSAAKVAIGKLAAQMVARDDFVFLDTGTTLTELASHLLGPVTIVTNSIDCAMGVSQNDDIDLHMIGGHFNPFFRAVVGAKAVRQLTEYRVNTAFIGVCGLTEHGLFAASEAEAQVKRAMVERADRVVLLCDQRKFGQQHCFQVCELSQVSTVISDAMPTGELAEHIRQHDIDMQCVVSI